MKLYYCKTTNPRKACGVAKYLNLPIEYTYVDLFQGQQNSPEFASVNPNQKVPVLIDGEVRVFESTAIMMYLSNSANSDLWPSNPADQVSAMQWITWDIAHLSRHASTVYFEHIIKKLASRGDPDPSAVEEAVGFFRQFAQVLDNHLKGRSHIVDDRLTIVDFGVSCVMAVARESNLTQLPISDFRNVSRWLDQLNEIPAWKDPWPNVGA